MLDAMGVVDSKEVPKECNGKVGSEDKIKKRQFNRREKCKRD